MILPAILLALASFSGATEVPNYLLSTQGQRDVGGLNQNDRSLADSIRKLENAETTGTIDTAKLATDAVTNVKILNGTIDTTKFSTRIGGSTTQFDIAGLFCQIGRYTGGANSPTITYPTAFSTLAAVFCQVTNTSAVNGVMCEVISPGVTTFVGNQRQHDSSALTDNFYWLACGSR